MQMIIYYYIIDYFISKIEIIFWEKCFTWLGLITFIYIVKVVIASSIMEAG